ARGCGGAGDQTVGGIDRKSRRQPRGAIRGGAVGGGDLITESSSYRARGVNGAGDHRRKSCAAAELVGPAVPGAIRAAGVAIGIGVVGRRQGETRVRWS